MKSIRIRLFIATLAVLLGSAIARSQDVPPPPPMHGHGFGGDHMIGAYADYLNLTDAQQAQMKTIMQSSRSTMKPLFQQSRQIEQQLHQYAEGTYDEAKVQALAAQKAQLEAQLTVQRTRIHNQMFQVLTADQQSQMKQLEARRAARIQAHMPAPPPPAPEE
jgi:periplasmic protein CpxP/Spy